MSNIKHQTEFRSFLASQSQQLILPSDFPSTRSSILSSSPFIQGQTQKTNLSSYQTPQKIQQRSSFFDPRAQIRQLNNGSDRQSLLQSSQILPTYSEGSDSFNTSIRNSIQITRKSFQDASKSSRSQQQANPSLQSQAEFLSDREICAPFVFPQPSKKPAASIRLSSSKIDLPTLKELNDNQGNTQNLPVQFNNSGEQQPPHQKRSVSLNPLNNDDILKDWLVGKAPQNTEPVAPKSIVERRKRRVSPAVINSANLIEDQPKIERPSSPSCRPSIGVFRSSNRRLSKREFKLEDLSISQLNLSAVQQVSSAKTIEQNRQLYSEDKVPEKKELSSPINSFLELKKMLVPTQSQRVSVTDLIKSMNTSLPIKKKVQERVNTNECQQGNEQENGSRFSKEQPPQTDKQQQPIQGITNGQEENDGDISNRYVPSSMQAGVPVINEKASPTRMSLKSSKGFMNLFRNSNEKVDIANKNTSLLDNNINNSVHSLVNSSSACILQQNINTSKESQENSGFLPLRKKRISMAQSQNLTESSFSSQSSGLKEQTPKLKGVLKNKSIDNIKSRNDSMNFSEMETLDETQNKYSYSMGLGMSQSTSNVSSFQKYIDQMDSSNAVNSSIFQKEAIKPSKKVMFQERVSIVDMATKYKTISTLTRLQNSKL